MVEIISDLRYVIFNPVPALANEVSLAYPPDAHLVGAFRCAATCLHWAHQNCEVAGQHCPHTISSMLTLRLSLSCFFVSEQVLRAMRHS